jgi:hypothetical protein
MINGPPKIVSLTVDLHENLVKVPLPVARFHPFDPAFPDLVREHRPKTLPPKPDRLMTDFYTAFVEQIFDIPKRQREPHIEHHCQADYLGARLEVLERGAFGHPKTLAGAAPSLKASSFDRTLTNFYTAFVQ